MEQMPLLESKPADLPPLYLALAAVLCHPAAGRIRFQPTPETWDRATRTSQPSRWEATCWVREPAWNFVSAPTLADCAQATWLRLRQPHYLSEAAELAAAAADVEAVLGIQGSFVEAERWGGDGDIPHLPRRFRVGFSAAAWGTVWCNGDTPARAFRCAAMVLRGQLLVDGLEAELPEAA